MTKAEKTTSLTRFGDPLLSQGFPPKQRSNVTTHRKPSPPPQAGVARVPIKSTLPNLELQRYRDSGSVISLQPGETLFEQGTAPEEMYAVLRGTLAVIMDGVQVAEIGEGQVAGEMAFLLDEKRTATLRALDTVEVHAISPQKMKVLLQHPQVAFGLLQLFSRRVEAANRALLIRTQTAQSARLEAEEHRKLHGQAESRNEELLEKQHLAAARIALLERFIGNMGITIDEDGTVCKTFPKPIAEEIDIELDGLEPPPAPPVQEAPAALPPPLPAKKPRVDETVPFVVERATPAPDDGFAEVGTGELTVLEERPSAPGPIQARRVVPVGGRTQTMMAFDPNAPMKEIVIDDRGSHPMPESSPKK